MGTQQATEFSKTLLAPSVVSLTATHYAKKGTVPMLDVQQIHLPKFYFNEFCFLFQSLSLSWFSFTREIVVKTRRILQRALQQPNVSLLLLWEVILYSKYTADV